MSTDNMNIKVKVNGAEKAKGDLGGVNSSIGNMIKNVATATAALYAMKKAFDFGVTLKNFGRDAEETTNKFVTVFSSIEDKAVRTAKTLAGSFGMASTTAMELLGDTGDILVGFGFAEDSALDLSRQINELAVDLASFTNYAGGASGASKALTKAMLGETESAKALGIVLRQGTREFKQSVDILQKNEKMTYNQAMATTLLRDAQAQSGKAAGDFARTQFQLANQERILTEQTKELQEVLGRGLLPTAKTVITDMTSFFGTLITEINLTKEGTLLLREEFLRLGDGETTAKMSAIKDEIVGIKNALEAEKAPGIFMSWKNEMVKLYEFIVNPFKMASDGIIVTVNETAKAIDDLTAGMAGEVWYNFGQDLLAVADFLTVDKDKVEMLQTELNTLSMALYNSGGRWEAYEEWARQFVTTSEDATEAIKAQILSLQELSGLEDTELDMGIPNLIDTDESVIAWNESINAMIAAGWVFIEKNKDVTEGFKVDWQQAAGLMSNMLYEAFDGGFDNIEEQFKNMLKRMMADLLVSGLLSLIPGVGGIGMFGSGGLLGGLGLFGGASEGGGGSPTINVSPPEVNITLGAIGISRAAEQGNIMRNVL